MARLNDITRLEQFEPLPIGFGTLRELYRDYKKPTRKIADLCSQGFLIRIKCGLYIVPQRNGREGVSGYLIANHLYGSSYVSLETALQHYGMIPERVYSYESVTIRRSKQYRTPAGSFRYHYLPKEYYAIGLRKARRVKK
jgi:predicted transcriptional regulator of viral defense system